MTQVLRRICRCKTWTPSTQALIFQRHPNFARRFIQSTPEIEEGEDDSAWKNWDWSTKDKSSELPVALDSPEVFVDNSSRRHEFAENASLDAISRARTALEEICVPKRVERFRAVVESRTRHIRFVFENPANMCNVYASMRTLDAFGVQDVDIIVEDKAYWGARNRRDKMSETSSGCGKWLTIRKHSSTLDCVKSLKEDGFRLVMSDLHGPPKPQSLYDVDWCSTPTAVVIGNEMRGVSDEMREMCDEAYRIPMNGFVESLNMSAAVSATISHLASPSTNAIRPDLSPEQQDRLMVRWLMIHFKQSTTKAVLRREGLI